MKNKTEFRLFALLTSLVILFSCAETSSIKSSGKRGIEAYKYYYDDNGYVLITRFKRNPNVIGTSWDEYDPITKTTLTKSNLVIFEDDSIRVVKKNQ